MQAARPARPARVVVAAPLSFAPRPRRARPRVPAATDTNGAPNGGDADPARPSTARALDGVRSYKIDLTEEQVSEE